MLSLFFNNFLFSKRSSSLIRVISWICVIGVSIAIMCLIVVMSVMGGFNVSIQDRLLSVKPDLVIYLEAPYLDPWLKKWGEENHFTYMRLFEQQDIILRSYDGSITGAVAKGYNQKELRNFLAHASSDFQYLISSKEKEIVSSSEKQNEISVVLGSDLAQDLGIYEGDVLTVIAPDSLLRPQGEFIQYDKIRIDGILRTEVQELNNQVVLYDYTRSLKSLSGAASKEYGIEIKTQDPNHLEKLEAELRAKAYRFENWKERDHSLFFALKMEKLIMFLFIGLSALITGFSIITILVLLMTQKRRDIGILRAMGMPKRQLLKIFVGIGTLLGGVGTFLGAFMGGTICLMIKFAGFPLLPSIYVDRRIPIDVDLRLIIFVLLIGFILSLLGSLWPVQLNLEGTPSDAISEH